MKIAFFKTNVLVPFIIILIAVFLFLVFAWQISKISVIEDPFFGKNPRLKSKVEIYKNPNGIPHIIADDVNDAMFAVGFAQASDRLWQMDYMRRVAKGELAEILGPQAIKFDQYFRALRLTHYSEIVFKTSIHCPYIFLKHIQTVLIISSKLIIIDYQLNFKLLAISPNLGHHSIAY